MSENQNYNTIITLTNNKFISILLAYHIYTPFAHNNSAGYANSATHVPFSVACRLQGVSLGGNARRLRETQKEVEQRKKRPFDKSPDKLGTKTKLMQAN